jgi:molybdenum cofactor cytidylyltransferase
VAPIDGLPLLARVLTALREYGPKATVVVLGHGAPEIENAIEWAGEMRVRNPDPDRGMASSLVVGFEALQALPIDHDGVFVVLGDQPALRVSVLDALAGVAAGSAMRDRPLIVPRYADDPGPRNPVLIMRQAWGLLAELGGDRGLAPLIDEHPELCLEVTVPGRMPDVDHPRDLEALGR